MHKDMDKELLEKLDRIASALDRIAPPAPSEPDFAKADAFIWQAERKALEPVARVNRVEMSLLRGIDRMRDILVENTDRFEIGRAHV